MVLSKTQELELSQYILESSRVYFGLNPINISKLAYQCAAAAIIGMPDSWRSKKSAERDWFFSFMNRHPALAIRKPEATSLAEPPASTKLMSAVFLTNSPRLWID